MLLAVVDGLGHGYGAAEASGAALEVLGEWQGGGLEELFRRAHDRLRRENPLRPRRSTVGRAVRRSDLVPRAAFRRTALYQDVDRVLGIEDTMSLWLVDRGRLVGGFAFDSVTRDFTSRDVLVLDTLAPHLARLHRATRIRAVHETAVVEELTPREREVLGVVAEGLTTREIAATLCIAPGTVRKHLDNIFAKLGVGTRAAAVRVLVGARFTVD
jgi:DNA-binding CsgD family transcriptional regulator